MSSSQTFDYVLGALAILGIPTIFSFARHYTPSHQLDRLDHRLSITENHLNHIVASGQARDRMTIVRLHDRLERLKIRALELRLALPQPSSFLEDFGRLVQGASWPIVRCARDVEAFTSEIEAEAAARRSHRHPSNSPC